MSYSRSAEYKLSEQSISRSAKAIAHPARLRILIALESEPLSLRQLREDHPISRPTLMKHLNVLIKHGLVSIESSTFPATYTTTKELWPPFITFAVRLTHRFKHLKAA